MVSGDFDDRRVIRLGLINPKNQHNMEGNRIYVALRKYGSDTSARAISREDFEYQNRTISGCGLDNIKEGASTESSSSIEGLPIVTVPYQKFIEILAQENNGRVVNETLSDGLELRSRIEKIARASLIR